MNLVVRITLLFVMVALVVFIVGGVISYGVMMREVNLEQERFLLGRLDKVESYISRRPPKDTVTRNDLLIIPLQQLHKERVEFRDTIVIHAQLQRPEPHLKLNAIKNVDGRSYFVSLYDVIIEPDDILDAVTESLVKTYLVLLVLILPVGILVSYYMFRPFRNTLEAIRNFSLQSSGHQVEFPSSRIPEFKKLNAFLDEMTRKVRHDYTVLKEFSENASHEIQTPIAIIQSKLEVLMDTPLSEGQLDQLIQVQNAIRRLSNVSNSLGMLTKLENNEFRNIELIQMTEVVTNLLQEFAELVELKKLKLEQQVATDVHLRADRTLIELLVTNLINNAIRHNEEGGFIRVELTASSLIVENSGADLSVLPHELFERFKKSNQSVRSSGLGLAIVKKIGELYGFQVSYKQVNRKHALRVDF
jgi:signal transduction histidine kinase